MDQGRRRRRPFFVGAVWGVLADAHVRAAARNNGDLVVPVDTQAGAETLIRISLAQSRKSDNLR
jgi:hypothetical protein